MIHYPRTSYGDTIVRYSHAVIILHKIYVLTGIRGIYKCNTRILCMALPVSVQFTLVQDGSAGWRWY